MSHHSHVGLGHPNDTVGIKLYNGDINYYHHDTVLKNFIALLLLEEYLYTYQNHKYTHYYIHTTKVLV